MFQPKKILVPTDFSAGSLIAAGYAGALARHFHCQVTLLYVNEVSVIHPFDGPLGFGLASAESKSPEHLQARRKEMDEFAAVELSGVNTTRLVCSGDPASLIVQKAQGEKMDLVIMTTHGTGRFRRHLLGSVTAKVLHDVDCPVWTCAHLAEPMAFTTANIQNVICAVDFGPQSSKVIRWAADFANELGSRLTIVHAVLETPPSLPERFMFHWHDEARSGAGERLRALVLDSEVGAEVLVVGNADIPQALSGAVNDTGAGLMVIGRGSASAKQRRLGSYTLAIICNAPCPVVSV